MKSVKFFAAFLFLVTFAQFANAQGPFQEAITNGTFNGNLNSWTASNTNGWFYNAGTQTAYIDNDYGTHTLTQSVIGWANPFPATSNPKLKFKLFWRNGSPASANNTATLEIKVGNTVYFRVTTPESGDKASTSALGGASDNVNKLTEYTTTDVELTLPVQTVSIQNLTFTVVSNTGSASGANDDFGISGVSLLRQTIVQTTPTPVTLNYFKGNVEDKNVKLNWETSEELNFSHYEIERSEDGKSYSKIDEVTAKGAYSVYAYTDRVNNATSGNVYYRLKAVDTDGTFEYSSVVKLSVNKGTSVEASAYPNPFKDRLSVNITTDEDQDMTLALYSLDGRQVMVQQASATKGSNVVMVNQLDNLAAGMYVLNVKYGEEVKSIRLVK